ncbi:class I SAM-dependent methyltransferase [Halomonas sp. SH5A2]|uniref:class I SAM-dependent methyltransferase n=1 Tax=Halomonas sp. SH5A2 TaxID=2749040 RepID=UPI00163E2115|nr:class I SAM-dependent methyltransferase [Halomonas sp. SH5A2]QNI02532.1 class I SAM-dependent methyltransferase [Halomonas sp. SH5A2]
MSTQVPACQLLERQPARHGPLWVVGPPLDPWLVEQSAGVVSADLAVLDAWRARGKSAYSPFEDESVEYLAGEVVLFWPKAHQLGIWWLEWLCEVLPADTPIDVVGEHNGGIKRVPKVLAERGMGCDKLDNARRCSLFATRTVKLTSQDDVWTRFEALGLTLISHPGVFGHGKVDEGTRLLLDVLESELPHTHLRVLDMGCGDGIISAWLAHRGHQVTAVDVSAFAVESTQRTLSVNGLEGRVVQSDVFSALQGELFDLIVSNPPFHQERDVSYGPSQRLISQAPAHLTSAGQLWLVANAFLPYPDLLQNAFEQFQTLADNRRFRVYRAQRH